MLESKRFLDAAILAAKEAGKIHQRYFNIDLKVKTKSSSFDLLTVADLEAEKKVVSTLREHFPAHNFLAEENRYKSTDSEYTWIIDPLDGTNNFAFKIPMFCVSIALARKDKVIVAVIYDVMRDELFSAEKNRGAFLNGKKIKVSEVTRLRGALLITGFYYDRGRQMSKNLEDIKHFFQEQITGIRRFGSAALDLCYIACGRASGFWEFELNVWDFAAGKLLIEEAGGKVTDHFGKKAGLEKSFIVASNGKIHSKMLKILNPPRKRT